MKYRQTLYLTLLLSAVIVLIKLASYQATFIESSYSLGFYHWFSAVMRTFLGWLPVSFGDILYGVVGAFLIFKLVRFTSLLFRNRKKIHFYNTKQWLKVLNAILLVYVVFNIFWGLNYNRQGVTKQLELSILPYSTGELSALNYLLVQKVNENKTAIPAGAAPLTNSQLFKKTVESYQSATVNYPFLAHKNVSLKSSLWGWLGNYAGFNGYYNPFTGEAQVNTTVPHFLQPFIACHEVAHQLGYAKEMEANFVGYLAASSSEEPLFRYSSYLDLFLYANRNLYFVDSVKAISYRKKLSAPVLADLKVRAKFSQAHQSFLEPIVAWGYGYFLLSNEQPQGMLSYDEVTGFLIAFYKKYNKV